MAVAILLERSPQLDADEALEVIRREHPGADPNAGFMAQLRLFHSMGCQLDLRRIQYRRFKVAQLARNYACGDGNDDRGAIAAAVSLNSDPESAGKSHQVQQGTVRCRKCGRLLALTEHIIPHEHGAGNRAFGAHKQRKGGNDGTAVLGCSSVFVEPIAWMGDALHGGAVSGKLACPKCHGRLGAFNWAGEQCSCGSWVTPAFQLHAGKVDLLPRR